MVPGHLVSHNWSPIPLVQGDRLWGSRSTGTKLVGDHLSMGTEFLGTICPWGQNWLGTVCPGGSINWGLIVGDQMSGDHMCFGPNVSQPWQNDFYFFFHFLTLCNMRKVAPLIKHSPLKKIPKLVIVELGLSQNIKSVGIEKGFLGGLIVVSNIFASIR